MKDASRALELDSQAVELMRDGRYGAALPLLEELARSSPDWEHGMVHYSLGRCYEETGRLSEAKASYQRAVQFSPTDRLRLGAYASFLYLNGTPEEALAAYLDTLNAEMAVRRGLGSDRPQTERDPPSDLLEAISKLGERAGLSASEVGRRISSAKGEGV